MSRWIDIGYKWNTETAYRVSQFLKENRIPFRMPSDDMFFQSMYHLPHRDRIWGIKVRRKDLARAMSLLEEEGLMQKAVIHRVQFETRREPIWAISRNTSATSQRTT